MDELYLTLPSNASMDLYPDNTLTHYNVQLPDLIELSGEHEIGLAQIYIPNRIDVSITLPPGVFVKIHANVENHTEDNHSKSLPDLVDYVNDAMRIAFENWIGFERGGGKLRVMYLEGRFVFLNDMDVKDPMQFVLVFSPNLLEVFGFTREQL